MQQSFVSSSATFFIGEAVAHGIPAGILLNHQIGVAGGNEEVESQYICDEKGRLLRDKGHIREICE